MTKWLSLVAAVLGVFSIALWLYGAARYNAGVATERQACLANYANTGVEAAKQLEREQNEAKKLSRPDLIKRAAELNILREHPDR